MLTYEVKDITIEGSTDAHVCAVNVMNGTFPNFHITTKFSHELWEYGLWGNSLKEKEKENLLKKIALQKAQEYIEEGREGPYPYEFNEVHDHIIMDILKNLNQSTNNPINK